jgi:hypothetical protein
VTVQKVASDHNRRVYLRPVLISRLASTAPGLTVIIVSVGPIWSVRDVATRWVTLGIVVALGATLAWRGYRVGAECRGDVIVVRNFLRSRAIPIGSVRDVTAHGVIQWESPRGRPRRTRMWAFTDVAARPAGSMLARNRAVISELRRATNLPLP